MSIKYLSVCHFSCVSGVTAHSRPYCIDNESKKLRRSKWTAQPSKHNICMTFIQSRSNVLVQNGINVIQMFCVNWEYCPAKVNRRAATGVFFCNVELVWHYYWRVVWVCLMHSIITSNDTPWTTTTMKPFQSFTSGHTHHEVSLYYIHGHTYRRMLSLHCGDSPTASHCGVKRWAIMNEYNWTCSAA